MFTFGKSSIEQYFAEPIMRIFKGSAAGGDRVNITTAERTSERKRARREEETNVAMCEKRKSNFERVFTPVRPPVTVMNEVQIVCHFTGRKKCFCRGGVISVGHLQLVTCKTSLRPPSALLAVCRAYAIFLCALCGVCGVVIEVKLGETS